MEKLDAVIALAALAQDNRLDVFRLLVQTGPVGMPAGAVAAALDLAPNTLTFHLRGAFRDHERTAQLPDRKLLRRRVHELRARTAHPDASQTRQSSNLKKGVPYEAYAHRRR
jgi:DNA-binding transcriptional ArsR family regulator